MITSYCFVMAEMPTAPLNVAVNAVRATGGGNVTITIIWMQPPNLDQFDIDRYDISVISTSGVQHMTTACGECTSTVMTVSENPSNVRMNTTFTITISARNRCGETGPTGTASYTLSKLPLLLYHTYMYMYSCHCVQVAKPGMNMCIMSIYCTYSISICVRISMLSEAGVSHQATGPKIVHVDLQHFLT